MEDSLTLGNKDGQRQINSENYLKTGMTCGITLHHSYDDTV